ncbi:hypothetical protein GCM10007094_18080 [Pseudovibrio japonicus]|uniref:Flagellar hook-length control protein-like C-terminal domain-containing protein n=1 Tax=Pseudovibrio japonicus TaxID=366534 RepID=A0ABQ3EBX7_9HYPH|nr:flagellar hook-length control protein FliK [Pseudovibrio japonicus]GHB30057.1 hypothetical protein GCM10007094_18080 [Pseudovibrio japonicus]
MSQSALPGISRPVQPQIPLKSVLGQGGSALLGESTPGQDLELFSGLLARASERDGAAAAAGDGFSTAMVAGGDLPVLEPDLIRDEKGESAVAGLAGELPATSVSQVLSHVAPGLIATAPSQDDVTLPTDGEGKAAQLNAKPAFIPAPQSVQNEVSQPNRVDRSVRSEVALSVAGQQGFGVKAVAGEEQVNAPTTAESGAVVSRTNQQTMPAGQILPQKGDELVGVSAGQVANEAGAVAGGGIQPVVEAVQNAEGLLKQNVGPAVTDVAVKQMAQAEMQLSAPVPPKTEEVAKVVRELGIPSTGVLETFRKADATQPSQTTITPVRGELSSGGVVDSAGVIGKSAGPDVVTQDSAAFIEKAFAREKAAGPSGADIIIKGNAEPSLGSRQISELAARPDVKALNVQAEPAQAVLPEIKGAGLAVSGDELAGASDGEADIALAKPILVRQSDRAGSGFVGQQQRTSHSVPVAGEGDLIFPNVTVKSDGSVEKSGQAVEGQKLAVVTAAQKGDGHVHVAEHVSRTASIATVATPMAGKDRSASGSVPATLTSDGSAQSDGAQEVGDQTSIQNKAADQSSSGTKKSAAAPVSIQVSVQQGNEQTVTTSSFGWGLSAGMQDGAEGELDWESSEAVAGTTARSEAGLRSVGSLPTSTLRNVANSVWPEIARQASGGVNRFEIRLDPKELGVVDVSIEFTKDGRVRAHLMVERPETLELLQRDQRGLEKALQDAGVESGKSSLEFSLGRGGGGSQGSEAEGHQQSGVGHVAGNANDTELHEASYPIHKNLNGSSRAGGLDISV